MGEFGSTDGLKLAFQQRTSVMRVIHATAELITRRTIGRICFLTDVSPWRNLTVTDI